MLVILQHSCLNSNICDSFCLVLDEYDLWDKVGYFTLDNATNNDTALATLKQRMWNDHQIRFDVNSHRLRCQGHIFNITVKAALYGTGADAFELEVSNA